MNSEEEKKTENIRQLNLVNLALELGFMIALPIVGLALLGRLAANYFNTSPILLLVGVILSMFISIALIYRKVKKVLH